MVRRAPSKSEVDRLGDRLRAGAPSNDDLVLLDRFRRSYTEAYESVVGGIRGALQVEPTGRPAKSTRSIVEKLRRETIRLSQMQDIAGCRFIVSDIALQNDSVRTLMGVFAEAHVDDRREAPSHGYRAVHLVASARSKPIEIQIRTELQHTWAELSEKYSDAVDPTIKYGGGPPEVREILSQSSELVAMLEQMELEPGGTRGEAVEVMRRRIRRLMQAEINSLRRSARSGSDDLPD